MYALKSYIKGLYRHLFLEDISKHASVTQKKNFLICGKLYRQALWPQRPKLGVRVAKALSCDTAVLFIFSGEPPPPWVILLRRGGTPKNRAIFLVPPLLNTITHGEFTERKGCFQYHQWQQSNQLYHWLCQKDKTTTSFPLLEANTQWHLSPHYNSYCYHSMKTWMGLTIPPYTATTATITTCQW